MEGDMVIDLNNDRVINMGGMFGMESSRVK